MDWYLFINIISLLSSFLAMILSIVVLTFIWLRIHRLRTNIPFILICNTYLTVITATIMLIEVSCRTIYGIFNPSITFGGIYCLIRAYFQYVLVSNVLYSLVVQAFFQLFHVVFYQKRSLRTIRVFTYAITFQWLFVFIINLLFFLFNDFIYISSEYRCLIAFTNLRGSIFVFSFAYILPTNLLFMIYSFIIRYVRHTNQAMHNRQFTRKRDLIVIKRIMILFIVLQIFSTPLAVLWMIYIITGHIVPLIYQLQTLTVASSQFFVTIIITFTTPQIQEKLKWKRQRTVHPGPSGRIQQNEITERIRMQRF